MHRRARKRVGRREETDQILPAVGSEVALTLTLDQTSDTPASAN